MRKFLLLGVSATAIAVASGASAADMGVPALKALPPAPFSWTGCYIGAHVGGGFMPDNWTGSNSAGYPPEYGGGWIAGGQVGCNYQVPGSQFLGGAACWSRGRRLLVGHDEHPPKQLQRFRPC